MTQKTNQNPWTMDVRVRERNLNSGALVQKDLEKFLSQLPDLADQAEPFGTAQPALAPPPAASEPSLPELEQAVEEEPAAAATAEEPAAEPAAAPVVTNGEGSL